MIICLVSNSFKMHRLLLLLLLRLGLIKKKNISFWLINEWNVIQKKRWVLTDCNESSQDVWNKAAATAQIWVVTVFLEEMEDSELCEGTIDALKRYHCFLNTFWIESSPSCFKDVSPDRVPGAWASKESVYVQWGV